MGDVLLTTPFIRQLRHSMPSARIDIITGAKFEEILRHNPQLDNVHSYRRDATPADIAQFRSEILTSLNSGKFDLVIDLQRNRRSARLRRAMGVSLVKLNKYRLPKLALVYAKAKALGNLPHVADRYRQTATQPEVEDDGDGLELWLPEERHLTEYPPRSRIVPPQPALRIALAPGAGHATKRWLPEGFAAAAAEVAKKYNATIVLLGGPEERDLCEGIRQQIGEGTTTINAAGADSVYQTARELDRCSLLLTNDSAAVHIAAARRIPVVCIYGSTVPAFGFSPYRVPQRIVEFQELGCRPCTHIGRAACPKGHFSCMRGIESSDVTTAIYSLLDEQAGAAR